MTQVTWESEEDWRTARDSTGFTNDGLGDHRTLADALVAYYAMDDPADGTAVLDETGRHDASISGAVYNGSGQVGSDSLSFDGTDDYANVPGFDTLRFNEAFTVTGWVRGANATSFEMLFGFYDSGTTDRVRIHATDTGVLRANRMSTNIDGTTDLTDGAWHHFAVTYAGAAFGDTVIYVDGAQENSGSETTAIGSGTKDNVQIGADNDNAQHYLGGDLDDVRFYRRVLSSDEISALASRTEPTSFPADSGRGRIEQGNTYGSLTRGLRGYYPLDDSSDTTLATDAANGYDADITGAVYNGTGRDGGDSLDLDGTDDYAHASGMPDTQEYTAMAWVNMDDASNTQMIIMRGQDGSENIQLYITGGGPSWRTYIREADGSTNHAVSSNAKLVTGEWVHVATTWDGHTLALYINGIRRSSTDVGDVSIIEPGQGTYLGARLDSAGSAIEYYMDGRLDEARVYDRAMSGPEIEAVQTVTQPSTVTEDDTL